MVKYNQTLFKDDQKNNPAPVKKESVVINTCKRYEIYSGSGRVSREITTHLFRLVSGLESPLLGEIAIQGQVKQAYLDALKNNISSNLHVLFQHALFTGKRVRNETGIAMGAMSYEQASINLLVDIGINISTSRIIIIGVHKMSRSLVSWLSRRGAGTIFIANRTYDKALALANEFNTIALSFDQLKSALFQSDIVISMTSAPHPIIFKKNLPPSRKMILIDLAVPPDIDRDVRSMPDINLYTLPDIEQQVDNNCKNRILEISGAEAIIHEEVENFLKKQQRADIYKG